ncbi:MAG: hypothetical protein ACKO2L_14015, partial [Planctomycetaceae bacterium]
MSLNKWLRECSRLWTSDKQRAAVARLRRKRFKAINVPGALRAVPETLEDRILPASLTWVGDLNTSWSANVGGNTNWSADSLPVDG